MRQALTIARYNPCLIVEKHINTNIFNLLMGIRTCWALGAILNLSGSIVKLGPSSSSITSLGPRFGFLKGSIMHMGQKTWNTPGKTYKKKKKKKKKKSVVKPIFQSHLRPLITECHALRSSAMVDNDNLLALRPRWVERSEVNAA